jgi:hypothetical protein
MFIPIAADKDFKLNIHLHELGKTLDKIFNMIKGPNRTSFKNGSENLVVQAL